MELHNLTPAEGSNKNKKVRIGRGQGSGKGGTAARGHKGAKSRSGYSRKSGFEGGQMPLQRRIPKFGFKNINRIEHLGINLDVLQTIADNDKSVTTIDLAYLVENGYAHKNDRVKILGRGELNAKLDITVHKFTKTAKEGIEAKGGTAVELSY
ncbi:50S ribosomal protein L15 [Flavobacteriales bacterium]|jgi:large subunit ribosomal protein L15|nr:50S ribosomal protein L15 [Flavobacteriales bacterium]MDA9775568.1 50S ribosomal protein L15 [Flavobacteriales bacterium]MDG1176162.1 50S ribosomal protein L15 [Flavobacteriales bacterium]|tara:strand:- start:833 stop:1291 length:459 start_codon:yes stop_codon:yes gene_type:complete